MAAACLAMTLEAVAGCAASRKLLVLDGEPGDWLPPGFAVHPQCGGGLAERLAHAWRWADGPGLQIGMDTPQITPDLLDECLSTLDPSGPSAALGPAPDGGWWALGLARGWQHDVFAGVPMSDPSTARLTRASLERAGHRVGILPELNDIDTFDDARDVAALLPGSALSLALGSMVSGGGPS